MEANDEVHLTELLPVKRSLIKEADNDDDAIADAFKALREGHKLFTQKKNDIVDFVTKCVGPTAEDSGDVDLRENNVQQNISHIINKYNYSKEERNEWCHDAGSDDKDIDYLGKRNSTKTNGIFKKRLKILYKAQMSEANNQLRKGNQIQTGKAKSNRNSNDDAESGDVNENRVEVKKKEFSYRETSRRRKKASENHSDVGDSLKRNEPRRDNNVEMVGNLRENKLIDDDDDDDESLNESLTRENRTSNENENEVNGAPTSKRGEDEARHKNAKSIGNEDSLRQKIDAIIQANYAIERKNNNTVQENRNKSSNAVETSQDSSPELAEKKHCCTICDARFKGSGGLRTHYKVVHATGPIFTCDECGKEFPLKERLKLHVRTHTGYKPYKCTECDKTFARGGQLVQHRRTHTQVKPYRCELCPGSFSCAANLALHVKRHNGQKDHKCEICGRAFVRRDALKKHLECLHKDVKSFLCVICNKTFKGHLPQHMRTHAQDRPHGCATCGQRFAQKSQLTVHQRTHSGQRPFRCLVCWQAFAHSTALKLHTRRHTGERPFKCAECNAGFTQLPHWKKHMRCVHGRSNPYCCKNCNTFFRIKNDLESHEKSCVGSAQVTVDEQPGIERQPVPKYRRMTVEKMRLLLAVLFKRISKPERLNELRFGKRLIDEVLKDSLLSAGKDLARSEDRSEFDVLKLNLATFLEWTVPKAHWEAFQKAQKTPEEILETLTVNQ